MKKKLLIILPACALAAIFLCFLLCFKGQDNMTLIQRANAGRYLSKNIFIDDETGEKIRSVYVAAANDSEAAEADSFLWFRNRYESVATHVELNLAFDSEGTAYLADSFDSANESAVTFERVLRFVLDQEDTRTGFVLNLHEYTNIASVAANIESLELDGRTVITGVNENSVYAVSRYFRNTLVLCDYSGKNILTLEQLQERGADGILCSYKDFSPSLLKKAKEFNLQVWVNCEADLYGTIKAIYHGADGIISANPDAASYCVQRWGDERLLKMLSTKFE